MYGTKITACWYKLKHSNYRSYERRRGLKEGILAVCFSLKSQNSENGRSRKAKYSNRWLFILVSESLLSWKVEQDESKRYMAGYTSPGDSDVVGENRDHTPLA